MKGGLKVPVLTRVKAGRHVQQYSFLIFVFGRMWISQLKQASEHIQDRRWRYHWSICVGEQRYERYEVY